MDQKRILIDYLGLKVAQEDWRAVSDTANDLRVLALNAGVPQTMRTEALKVTEVPLAAIPPVAIDIPHHLNEVRGLLKLSDEALVDRMFPDFSQLEAEEA